MTDTHWTIRDKWRFVWRYFIYKLLILRDVQKPKLTFFAFELRYSFANLLNTLIPGLGLSVVYKGTEYIHTTSGTFLIRTGSHDAAIISPAFERDDINQLIGVIHRETANNASIAFLDVGANIGSFSIRVGLETRALDVKIFSFEPIQDNLRLLQENLKLNQFDANKISVFPYALSNWNGSSSMSFNPTHPGDSKIAKDESLPIQVRMLDTLNLQLPPTLILKMDIEGHERQALEGMQETLRKCQTCWLCIEDMFDRQGLSDFLISQGFQLQAKLTPYNSWWILKNSP